MKLVNGDRQLVLKMKLGEINYLILESICEFRTVIDEIRVSIKDETDDWILSDEDEILKKELAADMILSPWTVDVNNKKIQKAHFKYIMKIIQQEKATIQIRNIMNEIQILLDKINDETEQEFVYDLEDFSVILKACNIHFLDDNDILSRLFQYIMICTELLNIKLFICVGMKNYFMEEELEILAREMGYRGSYILCIENFSNGTEKNRILIDNDLCRVV